MMKRGLLRKDLGGGNELIVVLAEPLTRLAVPFIPVLGEDASAVSQSNVGCCRSEAINLKAA